MTEEKSENKQPKAEGLSKEQEKTQILVEAEGEIQKKHGGRKPEYITMYFGDRLVRLTRNLKYLTVTLIILTTLLAILTAGHIYLFFTS
ncbi:hypothetical protein ACFLTP_05920 [Chloroflexota bacterium]